MIDAALIGAEASVHVGLWLGRDHYQIGYHQTATAGAFSGNEYIIISTDGNATYDEGVDLFFQVISGGTFDVADII